MNGIGCFLEGLQLIRQPGLRRYVVIPLVINVLVLSAAILYGVNQYEAWMAYVCLLYTSPSPRDRTRSRMPSSA